jgi:2-dehydro-3-deoxygalactonokinase
MDTFLSCDWGTSSFRLRLVDIAGLRVQAEERNADGIVSVFNQWTNKNESEDKRFFFFLSYIQQNVNRLEKQLGCSLNEVPVVLSGMASSSIGMIELPYKQLPFKTDGSDLNTHLVEPSEVFHHRIIIISGGATRSDVLRGEETLLVGSTIGKQMADGVYIFPGTHSKHVYVGNGAAQYFKTYMTGEFFDLLATKSILSNSVERDDENDETVNHFFEKGVVEGFSSNLLNSAFHVRTNQLFRKNTLKENYHYLSGLLIGAELKELVVNPPNAIRLVCSKSLKKQYCRGLTLLGQGKKLEYINDDEALIRGQWSICEIQKRNIVSLS